jgi:hypothetical protein
MLVACSADLIDQRKDLRLNGVMDGRVSSHPDEIQDDRGKNLEMMHLRRFHRKSCLGIQNRFNPNMNGLISKNEGINGPF